MADLLQHLPIRHAVILADVVALPQEACTVTVPRLNVPVAGEGGGRARALYAFVDGWAQL